ncbi:MAG: DUF4347 domain-containing protein, partial [Limnoraphis robusta]
MMFSNSGSTQTSYSTLSTQLLQDPEPFQKSQETCFSQASRTSKTNILVILDAQVEDCEKLQKGVVPQAKVILLDRTEDGIEQITQALRKYTDLSEIHIISHGSPGCLQLGNTQLSLDTLKRYASQLQTWSVPTLILYGCNVAAGDAGVEFIEKLHQITGAKIAASANKTGDSALGGDWNLEVKTDEFKVSLALTSEAIAHYSSVLVSFPVDTLTVQNVPATPLDEPVTTIDQTTGNSVNFTFGQGENLEVTGFSRTIDNNQQESYLSGGVLDRFVLRRVDNPQVSIDRQIIWYEEVDGNNNTQPIALKPTSAIEQAAEQNLEPMQVALFSDIINRGTDNIFANADNAQGNINNIERVDYISTGGLTVPDAPGAALDDFGFLLLERGGNDPFKIAAITALDPAGNPSAFGDLISFPNQQVGWGITTTELQPAIFRQDPNSDNIISLRIPPQPVAGLFISYQELLGDNFPDEQFFGYALFPPDIDETNDLVGLTDFPLNTPDESGLPEQRGGLDLIGGGFVFKEQSANFPPNAEDDTAIADAAAGPIDIPVLDNDEDPDDQPDTPLRIIGVTDPANGGTAEIISGQNGDFITYTPPTVFNAEDTFTYTITDGEDTDTATVTVTVNPPANQPPEAENVTERTRFNTAITFPLTITDPNENEDLTTIDLDPDEPGIQPTRLLEEGTFTLQPLVENQPPTVIFTPAPGFPGQADPITITYTVQDDLGAVSNPGTIAVTVTPNQPPTVADVEGDRIPNNSEAIALPLTPGDDFNDPDPDGEIVSITFTLPPTEQGVLLLNGEEVTDPAQLENLPIDQLGNVTFQPDPAFTGENVLFTYTVTDNDGASSTANITIPINPAPIAEDAEARTRIGIEVVVALDVSDDPPGEVDLNTIDLNPGQDGIQPTFTVRGQGTFTVVENQPSVLFTPVPEFTDEFTGGIVTIPYT